MNAVKRCLALIAATLVVGACGGDPTAEDAGADLSIRATPGAVWVRNNSSATVNIEAIDALGGPVAGTWAVGTIVGPLTAALDATYQNTTAGALGVKARFVITPTAEGEGSVQFTGTGGAIVVPVRMAPDTNAFNVTFSSLTPALAEEVVVTAPAGMRFTSATTVNFYNSPTNTLSNGLAAPTIISMSADSTQLTFLPAPGANGQVRFTAVASISTPGLVTNARSTDVVTVPALLSVAAVISNAAPAANTTITLTMPANFKFRPTSTMTLARGNLNPVVIARSADSNQVTIMPVPSTSGAITISAVQFAPLASLSLALPTSGTVTTGAVPNLGADDFFVDGIGALGQLTANLAVGGVTAWFDTLSLLGADNIGDGGIAREQDYSLTFTNAGTYQIRMWFPNNSDIDLFLVDETFSAFLGQSFNGDGVEEVINFTATAGQVTVLTINMWAGTIPALARIQVTRTS